MRIATTVVLLTLAACSVETGDGSDGRGKDRGEGRGDAPEPVTVVEVAEVGRGSVADTLTASAVVESERQADIIPEVTGVVTRVERDEGDPVQKGDLLAVLDNVALGTGAQRTAAEVARLEAQVAESRRLAASGALSERDLREIEFQLETARLQSREASSSYGSTRLTAPFDGVVAMRDVRVGELATTGAPAFRVVDLTDLRVVASLPERDLKRVAPGQSAKLVSAYDTDVWTDGTVERISPVVDAGSGTFRVTIALAADQTALRPGQFVSVSLEVDRRDDVWVVPREALVYEDGAPVVYAVVPAPDEEEEGEEDAAEAETAASWWPFGGDAAEEPDAAEEDEAEAGPRLVAERHLVELGLVDTEWAEIQDGLEGGETVITVGQSHLRDGARVRPAAADDPESTEAADAAEAGAPGEDASGDKG